MKTPSGRCVTKFMFGFNCYSVIARYIVQLLLILFPCSLYARNTKTVEGTGSYEIPHNVSLEEAEAIALQRAIINALASEFGTVVQSEVWTELQNDNENSSSSIWSNGLNLVKGEWLEIIGSPEIKYFGSVVEIKVKGLAAEIQTNEVDIDISVNQSDGSKLIQGPKFISGNNLIVDFKCPVDGYLAIFLADTQSNVMQLLPFANEPIPSTKVVGGKKYCFFESNAGIDEEQYSLYTDNVREHNILYILFSTNQFTKPLTDYCDGINILKADYFRKWLSRQRAADPSFQAIIKPILIVESCNS